MIFYTDGACSGNPGKGGFGVIRLEDSIIKYVYRENSNNTTNNREELKGILYILKQFLGCGNQIIIYSDSAYCVNIINDWIWKWANKNWINSQGCRIENLDLIEQIYNIIKPYETDILNPEELSTPWQHVAPAIQVIKIKGHQGNIGNELADAIATGIKSKIEDLIQKFNLIIDLQ